MAGLHDMEELVGSIQNAQTKDYMREALACYMAGAYRACVVLTFIALFDDILAKLGALGKVNKKAKKIFDEATNKRADQDVFENYLIEQLKATELLSALDTMFLEMLRQLRNKAAHPSGHHASPEEARFIFFEAIDRFLSKQILSTTQLVDEILAGIGNSNVFPTTNIKDIAAVVRKELQNIHQEAYPYLITKMLEKYQTSEGTTQRNARFFLSGLAWNAEDYVIAALKKYAVESKCSNEEFDAVVFALLSANGKLFAGHDGITYQRLAKVIAKRLSDAETETAADHSRFSHPASLFVSLLKSDPSLVSGHLSKEFDQFIERFCYSAYFAAGTKSIPMAQDRLFAELLSNARASDFGTANGFVRQVGDVADLISSWLSPEQAFKMLCGVLRAADIGAFGAIDMRRSKFATIATIKEKAQCFLVEQPAAAKAIATEILGIKVEGELDDHLAYLEANEVD